MLHNKWLALKAFMKNEVSDFFVCFFVFRFSPRFSNLNVIERILNDTQENKTRVNLSLRKFLLKIAKKS